MGLPKVLEGAQLNPSHSTSGLAVYPPIILTEERATSGQAQSILGKRFIK